MLSLRSTLVVYIAITLLFNEYLNFINSQRVVFLRGNGHTKAQFTTVNTWNGSRLIGSSFESNTKSSLNDVLRRQDDANDITNDSFQRRQLLKNDKLEETMRRPDIDAMNDRIVMFITSTAKDTGRFIRERIIPSKRTWLRYLKHVFVVVEDTASSRLLFRHCKPSETHSFTLFECPDEPTYILTRKCTSAYYDGDGIGCKVDSALYYLIYENPSLLDHIQYAFVGDDDEYWRVDELLKWLLLLNQTGSSSHIHQRPLVGNNYPTSNAEFNGVWGHEGCKEVQSMGWYQPMMLNRNALDRVKVSVKAFGITELCREFEVSQDVGLSIWAWMHQLHHIHIPKGDTPGAAEFAYFQSDSMFIHAVKHFRESDNCDGRADEWKNDSMARYNQSVMIGCGDVDKAIPGHNRLMHMDMYDAWNYFTVNGTEIPFLKLVNRKDFEGGEHDWLPPKLLNANDAPLVPLIKRLQGYERTEHSRKYDITKVWVPYRLNDCSPKPPDER